MMMLLSKIDEAQYGIDTRKIIEVIPYIDIKKVAQSHEHIAGVINYRGKAIVIIDMPMLLIGRRAKNILSTRIVVVGSRQDAGQLMAGLLIEHATEVLKVDDSDLLMSGVNSDSAGISGDYIMKNGDIIQCIDPVRLMQANKKYLHKEEIS